METRTKAKVVLYILIAIVVLATSFLFYKIISEPVSLDEDDENYEVADTSAHKPKEYLYGFDLDSFSVIKSTIKSGQTFSDVLGLYGVNYNTIVELEHNNTTTFNARYIIAGKPYTVFTRKNTNQNAAYMVYEAGTVEYYILQLEGNANIKKISRQVETKRMEVKGTITSSLYETFEKNNLNIALAMELSEIFAWTVDFYKIQKGDAFKVIYFEKFVEGKSVGIDRVEAAYFNNYNKPFYAFRFEEAGKSSFFDENGNSVKKMFLKAPLKFSRISSRYNLKRFHPVLKRTKAHLGTDYAAPKGTPIMTVGDGVILEASYTAGNGNYVKVKHNATYTTQYLHMSKFGKGIRKGKSVRQGDVIGYVGSTGLATGPHLCFRFWKNGKQVDPLREKLMQTFPIKKESLAAFKEIVNSLKPSLDKI